MNIINDIVKVVNIDTHILQITLNRPSSLNALNNDLMDQLKTILENAKTNETIKALLLTGEGKAFCAGADINELSKLNAQTGLEFARRGQALFRLMEQLGKPTVAAINGFALGGGCELAMAATIRIASTAATFSQPEIKLGVIPGFGGTQRLSRLVGKGRALELCLTGRTIKAEEALQWGLVSEVVAPDQLLNKSIIILKELTKLGPIALKSIMTVIDRGYDLSLEDAFELEAAHFGLCSGTFDKQEGVSAFLEKRHAEFIGK